MVNRFSAALLAVLATALALPAAAQQNEDAEGMRVARLQAEPASLTVEAGQQVPLGVTAYDAAGNPVEVDFRYAAPRTALRVGDGMVRGLAAGDYEIIVTPVVSREMRDKVAAVRIPVTVTWPRVARVEIEAEPGQLYEGTTLSHDVAAYHADDSPRPMPTVEWSSSDPTVASVDRWGNVSAHARGEVTITAAVDGTRGSKEYTVAPFPATQLEITGGAESARQGDVLSFGARALDESGQPVGDVPVTWSYTFVPDDSIVATGAGAVVTDEGRFVGEIPGQYTVLAIAGPLVARKTIDIRPRSVVQRIEKVGHGPVRNVHSSDLWIFEGRDGRDYAITGTWGGEGKTYIWDVTDPTDIVKTDSVQVDARTVNDVKVSPDARYAALSREGASNRRNGVVILDLANPAHPTVASVYDEGLTGGVHNMFATDNHLFALSAGDKYVILDVRDLENPRYVSEYDHPESRLHDVWVENGIAYSSEWQNGVVAVDVGNGKWGGSIQDPKLITNVPYPVGRTHAAFPYHQQSTGKTYLFLGDEILDRSGMALEGQLSVTPYDPATGEGGLPSVSAGYIHVIDFTDPENPKDVARYHVPEFGTHNLWVENDKLYQAYYEGGLRIVDVSGELLGDLGRQGREIAVFKPYDPIGFIANAPMVWGAQPHKGFVFFSDFNSGLWAAKLEPPATTAAR